MYGELKATFGIDLVCAAVKQVKTVISSHDHMPVTRGYRQAQYPLLMAPVRATGVVSVYFCDVSVVLAMGGMMLYSPSGLGVGHQNSSPPRGM